jgi:hypothetical protein
MRRLLLLSALLAATPAAAQMVTPNARAAGMGFAYGAVARGFSAGFYNPANLGQSGNPGFTLGLPMITVDYGSEPIPFQEFKDHEGEFIDDETKSDWLDRIGPDGALTIRGTADIGEIGVSIGPIAVTVGTVGSTRADLPHDAVELLLFGNAGEDGSGTDTLEFTDGTMSSWAASRVGLSIGLPIGHRLSIGVTGKYLAGHGLAAGRDGTAQLTPDSGYVRFPVIVLVDEDNPVQSDGFGVDVGMGWRSMDDRLRLGVVAYDVYNNFKWDATKGRATTGDAFVSVDSSSSDFDDVDLADATDSVRAAAERLANDAIFAPAYRLSGAYRVSGMLLVSADALFRTGNDFALGKKFGNEFAFGAEVRILPFLPLRGGIRTQGPRTGFNGGVGLDLGPIQIDGAVGKRTDGGWAYGVGLSLIGQ